MSRQHRILPRHLRILPVFLLLAACASGTEARRPEGSALGIRVPPVESFEFTRKTESPYPPPPAPAPFFEDDAYRYTGRWLTLIEVQIPLYEPPGKAPESTGP